jgi:hypothetical protein
VSHQIRAWTLGSTGIDEFAGARVIDGPSVMPGNLEKVIELDKVLDWLESGIEFADDTRDDIQDFLKEHGGLK